MPRKDAPEFSYNEKTELYRKKIKNPDTGKWISVYGHTKPELRDKVKTREQQLAVNATAKACPYVYQYAATWYSLNTAGLSDSRKEDYTTAINLHICPVIGQMCLCDVKSDDIRRVMTEASHLSRSSQAKIVTTLKRIFDAAEDNGLIDRTPCRKLKAGGTPSREKTPLTEDQQQRLISALAGTKAYLFVMLGLYTGMRREEILALQWDCVHLKDDPAYVEVRRALRWKNSQPVVEEKLKSAAASRKIPIPQQLQAALKAEEENTKSEFVIANTKGKALSNASYKSLWNAVTVRSVHDVTIKDKNGKPQAVTLQVGDTIPNTKKTISIDFDVTPHLLRHTYISMLILSGVNLKTVQYLAGHATAQMTLNIYAHLIGNQPKDTSGAVFAAFGDKNGDKKFIK